MSAALTRPELEAARRQALRTDVAAVAASLAANVAAAPATVGGWLVAAIAPLGLFAVIALWHRARGVLAGPLSWLFNVALAGIGSGAAVVSFGHLRTVAEAHGQTGTSAVILPLVVDALAVAATLVVIGSGHQLEALDAAEAAEAEARQLDAERAERERLEVERAERLEVERLEAEAAERLAAAELERETAAAEMERARLDAEAETARLAAAQAERAAIEAKAAEDRRARLAALQTAPAVSGPQRSPRSAGGRPGAPTPPPGPDRDQAIADLLAESPDMTQAEIGAALGVSAKTVQRSAAWSAHQATRTDQTDTDDQTEAAEAAA